MKYFFNLADYFYDVASRYCNNNVLAYKDKIVSYSEINRLSNQIANYFLSIGIKQNDVIGIFNTKAPLGYASMLACIKIGAIYTNIDEENPPERLKKILNTCKPKILIFDHVPSTVIIGTAEELNIDFIDMKSNNIYLEQDDKNLEVSQYITGSNPAYIMFTSGSTGIPKGVLISHENILSFIGWSIEKYKITQKDRFVQVSPMSFDNSVFDFYTALYSGASLMPVSKEISKKPHELVKLAEDLKCTIWFSVPTLLVYLLTMRVLSKDILRAIRVFTFGGEGFPKGKLKKLYELYGDRAKLINVYGPTEGTCICSSYEISTKDFENINSLAPLGTINPNFEYCIVDKEMRAVKSGEKGELCLMGPNVGLGYYNDIERTEKSFIQNPLVKSYKAIIYKTGDIVYEKDTLLWFAGRVDNQIKHMGYRIELEEIEAALNSLIYVNQSAVLYERVKESYGKIIAFVASKDDVDESKIREDLDNILPRYMVPNIIEVRRYLPKSMNGKVDRNYLKGNSL